MPAAETPLPFCQQLSASTETYTAAGSSPRTATAEQEPAPRAPPRELAREHQQAPAAAHGLRGGQKTANGDEPQNIQSAIITCLREMYESTKAEEDADDLFCNAIAAEQKKGHEVNRKMKTDDRVRWEARQVRVLYVFIFIFSGSFLHFPVHLRQRERNRLVNISELNHESKSNDFCLNLESVRFLKTLVT